MALAGCEMKGRTDAVDAVDDVDAGAAGAGIERYKSRADRESTGLAAALALPDSVAAEIGTDIRPSAAEGFEEPTHNSAECAVAAAFAGFAATAAFAAAAAFAETALGAQADAFERAAVIAVSVAADAAGLALESSTGRC